MRFPIAAALLLGSTSLASSFGFNKHVSRAPDTSNPFPMPLCNGHRVFEATISQLQDAFLNGLTSRQLVECYFARADLIDGSARTILERNPDALSIADAMDLERSRGISRGPMHGIPVLTKDNIATDDKVDTTAGSTILLGSKVPRDAHVVALLRKAGAILLGHSNLSEWADMRSDDYSEGFSERGGQVRNVYNLTQNPGGSSSGSAHGVSANLVTIAFGTETDGSVIAPSSRAGIIGFKPTVGLTSRAGVIPESTHQDTVGSFARTFRDAVIGLETIAGPDPRDEATLGIDRPKSKNYTQFLTKKHHLHGAKFGVPWTRVWQSPSTAVQIPALLEAIKVLEAHGATVYNHTDYKYPDTVSPDGWNWDYGPANESEYTYVKVDFYNNVASYLSELSNTTIRSLSDIIAANDLPSSLEGGLAGTNPAFADGQQSFLDAEATGGVYSAEYYSALAFAQKNSREDGIDYALNWKGMKLDGLLVPSDPSSAAQNLISQAGYPCVTIPVGVDEWGVPFGISLVNTAFSEPILVKYGSAIDDALGHRRVVPTFLEFGATNIPINGAYSG
ncbi:Glutamyl-tRNA amidotransferase subunit A (Glu-ADT subunit A) [Meredithblackwellia eburnea MCA 4105]